MWAERTGYLRVFVDLGARVEAGDVVADIRDDFGAVMTAVTAPDGGRVFFRMESLAVTAGELVLGILAG